MNYETYFLLHLEAPCYGLQGTVAQYAAYQNRKTGANPFSFRALGSFTCITQQTRPTALFPYVGKASWLSVLLKDTSVMTGTQTYTLLIKNTRA